MVKLIYSVIVLLLCFAHIEISASIDKNSIAERKKQSDFIQFESYLDSLLSVSETRSDTSQIAIELFYLGVHWAMNNHYEKGAELLTKAGNLFSAINSDVMVLYSYYYKANYLWHLSRYNEALFELNKAFITFHEKGVEKKYPGLIYQLTKEFAIIKSKLGDYNEAVSYFEDLEIYYRNQKNDSELGSILLTLGIIYEKKQDFKEAALYYSKAIAVSEKIKDKHQRIDRLSAAHNNLGCLEHKSGKYDASIKNLQKAVSLLSDLKHEIDVCYCDLAEAFFSAGRYAESRAAFQDALLNNPDNWNAYNGLAKIAERDGNYSSADSLYRKAVEAAEKRAKFLEGISIVSFFESVAPVYREATRYFASRKGFEESFAFSERSRARYMEYLSALASVKISNGSAPALYDSLKRLEQALTAGYLRKKSVPDFSVKDELALKTLEIEKDRFLKKIRETNPDESNNWRSDETNIATIRKSLDKTYQILEYSISRDALTGLVITGDTIIGKVLPLQEDSLRRRVTACLQSQDGSLEEHYRLYQDLFKPFREYLSDEKELIIVPDGILYYLPFEMLVTKTPEGKNMREIPYLVNDYAISYVPSASVFAGRIREISKASYNYAGFAASEFQKLPPLNFAKGQIEAACGTFSMHEAFTNPLEIKERIFQEAGDYKILDFATHAVVTDYEPLYSKILFFDDTTLTADSLTNSRSALYGYEVYNLNLSADLVVLGGCRTGLGRYADGEGIVGFQHAFSYAGAHSLLMSLWPVEDYSTAEIIASFYSYLNQGYSKPKALQFAKKDFLAKSHELHTHPQFWAGLTIWGNPEKIEFCKDYRPVALIALSGLGLGIIVILKFRKKKLFSQKTSK